MQENPGFIQPEQEKRELFKQTTLFINAGGRGTRLEPILPSEDKTGITKALIHFGEERIIDFHIKHALKMGYGNVIISAGDHKNIVDYLEGKQYGDNVQTALVDQQLGTAGDLLQTIDSGMSFNKETVVQNVDTFVFYDEAQVLRAHQQAGLPATIVLTGRQGAPNENAWKVAADGHVISTSEDKSAQRQSAEVPAYEASSTGVIIFDTQWLKEFVFDGDSSLSLYADMLPKLIAERKLNAYYNDKYLFYDVGTPENFKKTIENKAFLEAIKKYY